GRCVQLRSFILHQTASPAIYTLSLHDALPISRLRHVENRQALRASAPGAAPMLRAAPVRGIGSRVIRRNEYGVAELGMTAGGHADRKSTRLNSSHRTISYAVFCLKKKKSTYA